MVCLWLVVSNPLRSFKAANIQLSFSAHLNTLARLKPLENTLLNVGVCKHSSERKVKHFNARLKTEGLALTWMEE